MFTEAGPTSAPPIKRSMTTRLTMLAAGAAVSVALMTATTPAMAQEDPNDGSSGDRTSTAPTTAPIQDEGLDANSVALGALSGIALTGAGLGLALGLQRRRDHAAMPIA